MSLPKAKPVTRLAGRCWKTEPASPFFWAAQFFYLHDLILYVFSVIYPFLSFKDDKFFFKYHYKL